MKLKTKVLSSIIIVTCLLSCSHPQFVEIERTGKFHKIDNTINLIETYDQREYGNTIISSKKYDSIFSECIYFSRLADSIIISKEKINGQYNLIIQLLETEYQTYPGLGTFLPGIITAGLGVILMSNIGVKELQGTEYKWIPYGAGALISLYSWFYGYEMVHHYQLKIGYELYDKQDDMILSDTLEYDYFNTYSEYYKYEEKIGYSTKVKVTEINYDNDAVAKIQFQGLMYNITKDFLEKMNFKLNSDILIENE